MITNEIDNIHLIINKHIKTLSEDNLSNTEKDIEYELLGEAIEALIRKHKKYTLFNDKKNLRKANLTILDIRRKLFVFEINHPWDLVIAELYDKLVNIHL